MERMFVIQIGLTGWGDHPDLASSGQTAKDKLIDYTAHFPVVELDSTFYAIQPERNIRKWLAETPDAFQFIVKAFQGITGHEREPLPYESKEEMIELFLTSLEPMRSEGKLAMILVQFPPWFDCVREHVEEIRWLVDKFKGYDVAIEFRHQSWYTPMFKDKTIQFLQSLHVIHSVCDEPQAGDGSIPLVPITTRSDKVLMRLHGRNVYGWTKTGKDNETWRKVRYLYEYNAAELQEIEQAVTSLQAQAKEVYVIFNNNSGKHAAKNAKQFQQQLNIQYDDLAAQQLSFFEEEW